ncbi:hypothetical protein Tsubulata_009121 [Turnera subulata]|nr:hypothetical protein Tsubulata_009121 [Turnera subulata]
MAAQQAIRETEELNDKHIVEKRVETIEHRSSPGQPQEVRRVEVVHQPQPSKNANTTGKLLENAAASVVSTLDSAKQVLSGK